MTALIHAVTPSSSRYEIEEPFDAYRFEDAPEELLNLITSKREPQPHPPPLSPFEDYAQAQSSPDRLQAYVETALADEFRKLSATTSGRNAALNIAALKLGQLIGPDRLDEQEVRATLIRACEVNGYLQKDGRAAVLATIESGLAAGMTQPREPQDRREPQAHSDPRPKADPAPEPATFEVEPWCPSLARAIPRREFVYGTMYIAGHVTMTAAAGAAGKSSLIAAEVVDMVTGKSGLYDSSHGPIKVLIANLEDHPDETYRKVAAVCEHRGIDPETLKDRLFLFNGRKHSLVITSQNNKGIVRNTPLVELIIETIIKFGIKVLIIDPLISSHHCNENDNSAMDAHAKTLNYIAERTGVAIHCVHHMRKGQGDAPSADSARGARSPVDAARAVRLLVGMTAEQGEEFGVENHRLHFQTVDAKMNLAPPAEKGRWYRIITVTLANGPHGTPGDQVGVVETWSPPSAAEDVTTAQMYEVRRRMADGDWRDSPQSGAWAGHVVADVLGLDVTRKGDRTRIIKLLAMWKASGALKVVDKPDAQRRPRPHVIPGDFNE